jgi:hypothetical protein
MAICSNKQCGKEFTPHRPREFRNKEELRIDNQKTKKRLLQEGKPLNEVNKFLRDRIKEEHETWRCKECDERIKRND